MLLSCALPGLLFFSTASAAPLDKLTAQAVNGAPLYRENCQSCHGEDGDGKGPKAPDLPKAPTDFSAPNARLDLTQARMLKAVRDGHLDTTQALWRKLTDVEELAILDYIRAAFMPATVSKASANGISLYVENCATCHGIDGSGQTAAKDYLNPAPKNFTALITNNRTHRQIINAVNFGITDTAMKGYAARLSPEDIIAIADYIIADLATGKNQPTPPSASMAQANTANTTSTAPQPTPLTPTTNLAPANLDTSPFPDGLVGNFRLGKTLYQTNCQPCHGREGEGNGPRSHVSQTPPPPFGTASLQENWSRPELFKSVSKGKEGTAMSAWETILLPQDIADVAEYLFATFARQGAETGVATLPSTTATGTARQLVQASAGGDKGRDIFIQRCALCHGFDGKGLSQAAKYMSPHPKNMTALRTLNRLDVMDIIRRGKQRTAMPSFAGVLNEDELNAVTDFVLTNIANGNQTDENFHTEGNGWPRHRLTYAEAFPFATGRISPLESAKTLTPKLRGGLNIFLESCIACHDPLK